MNWILTERRIFANHKLEKNFITKIKIEDWRKQKRKTYLLRIDMNETMIFLADNTIRIRRYLSKTEQNCGGFSFVLIHFYRGICVLWWKMIEEMKSQTKINERVLDFKRGQNKNKLRPLNCLSSNFKKRSTERVRNFW